MKQPSTSRTSSARSSARRRTVPPKGHSTVRSELIKAAEEVQYGRATPAQAAEAFVSRRQGGDRR